MLWWKRKKQAQDKATDNPLSLDYQRLAEQIDYLPQDQQRIEQIASHTWGSHSITEQVNYPTPSSSPTLEDWYWGRFNGTEDDLLWRRLTDIWYQKDLLPSTYLEIHNRCYETYNANPLALAIIELTTSFVLGEGLTVSACNKRVQEVIDSFWHHPENHMDERIYSLCTELSLYGEQFIHFFVNTYNGTVIIRQIDPSLIDQIETDPEDIEKPLRFHRRPIGQVMTATSGDPPPQIVHMPTSEDMQGTWFKAGEEVLHIAINKVSNAKRGKSDLATLLTWLKRYQEWLIDRARINKYKTAFLWDVTLRGADKKTLDRKQMEYTAPPQPGTVLVHSEAEKWTAVEPQINAGDASADARAIKLMVAVGATLPEHYLSDGDYGNRATASEMSLPTMLKFKRRQRIIRYMLTCILDRVIKEAQRVGKLGPRIDTSYDITFPEIDSEEHNVLAQGMNWLVPALQTAKAQGWISDETAMKIMFEYCGEEVDIHAELEKIKSQRQPAQGKSPASPSDAASPHEKATAPLQGVNGYGHALHPWVTYDGGFR